MTTIYEHKKIKTSTKMGPNQLLFTMKYNNLMDEFYKLQCKYDNVFSSNIELINDNERLKRENAKFVTDIKAIKDPERSFSKYDQLLADYNRIKIDLDIQIKDKKQLSEEVDRLANCCMEKDDKIKELLQSLRDVCNVVLYKQDKDERGEF